MHRLVAGKDRLRHRGKSGHGTFDRVHARRVDKIESASAPEVTASCSAVGELLVPACGRVTDCDRKATYAGFWMV